MLELGMTALVSRFDPLRILAIRRTQVSTSYNLTVRNLIAFDWGHDVQGDGEAKAWDKRPKVAEIQRALLGDHYHDLFWEEAFQQLLDNTVNERGIDWMDSLHRTAPDAFTTRMRTEAARLYSQLSKGVHQEFVIPAIAQFDEVTVRDLLARAYELLAGLGLVAANCPSLRPVLSASPLDAYKQCHQDLTI